MEANRVGMAARWGMQNETGTGHPHRVCPGTCRRHERYNGDRRTADVRAYDKGTPDTQDAAGGGNLKSTPTLGPMWQTAARARQSD